MNVSEGPFTSFVDWKIRFSWVLFQIQPQYNNHMLDDLGEFFFVVVVFGWWGGGGVEGYMRHILNSNSISSPWYNRHG